VSVMALPGTGTARSLSSAVAASLAEARPLYLDLLADIIAFAQRTATKPVSAEAEEAFLADVRDNGHDVGLYLLTLLRSLARASDPESREALAALERARPLIDSLCVCMAAVDRESLLALPLASAEEIEALFAQPELAGWLEQNV